jgi:hypothetical protein
MIAPMGLVADQAALIHRWMFPHERPSFFGMAFVTEVIDRVGLYHFISAGPARSAKTNYRLSAKTAHRIVAAGACQRLSSDKGLFHRMMGLLIYLSPDVPVTVEAKVRLCCDQQFIYSLVYRVAAIT